MSPFKARVYFLYNNTKHAFLSTQGQWTSVFWEAQDFKSFAQINRVMDGALPDNAAFTDCEIFATQGIWLNPPR
jgi:hypothetical protein